MGNGAAQGAQHRNTHTQIPSLGLLLRLSFLSGTASGVVKGVSDFGPRDDPALGLQRLSRSKDGQAARSGADSPLAPTGLRSPAKGNRVRAPRSRRATLSPAGPALASGAATRARTSPSCSPAAGSSAPGPRGLAGPGLRPVAPFCLKMSLEELATRTCG